MLASEDVGEKLAGAVADEGSGRARRGRALEQGDRAGAVVTVKTVELHLSSTCRKLALGSRRELAAALDVGT